MKKVLVHRFAAIGDSIIITPLLEVLKQDGYHVTLNTTKSGRDVLRHNPNIDVFLEHDTSIPPGKELDEYLSELNRGYDRVIDLCESIEGSLAKVSWRKDFYWSQEKRHRECNKNFYDYALELGGYPDIKGKHGSLYFTKAEEQVGKKLRQKHKDKFMVMWSMSGSSPHKVYPYSEDIIELFLNRHKDAVVFTVGDVICQLIEPHGKRIKNYSGIWAIRKSLMMTKYVDLVVGPDTGLMHGAGCFDTPKILLLSSNTEENLSKTWENCVNLVPPVDCHPCHRLHYSREFCPLDEELRTPVCMTKLKGEVVLDAMENAYSEWKDN